MSINRSGCGFYFNMLSLVWSVAQQLQTRKNCLILWGRHILVFMLANVQWREGLKVIIFPLEITLYICINLFPTVFPLHQPTNPLSRCISSTLAPRYVLGLSVNLGVALDFPSTCLPLFGQLIINYRQENTTKMRWNMLLNIVSLLFVACLRFLLASSLLLLAVSLSTSLPYPGMIAWVCKSCPNPNMLFTAGEFIPQHILSIVHTHVQMLRWSLPVESQLASWNCSKVFQGMKKAQKCFL